MRKEFERTTPESQGIPSSSIEWLLDRLEEGFTEPHGLMIMKNDKVIAEGWWAPYAPGIIHGLQSHTKTYAATAVGIAYTEGKLELNERIIDIFPEYAPEKPSENLELLTVRDVLCMGTGMTSMPKNSKEWIRDFLNTPVVYKPGTAFMYNSMGSSLLCAIVKKKTGLGMMDYLRIKLFNRIGIDTDSLKCMLMDDGTEMGGGGLFAATEDNLRLMKLYLDNGIWEGEQILSEEYVRLATTLQNESATERAVNPPAEDNFVGYGFQIWMCRREGVYRADGAMGQFTIVFPDKNMILAITENASGSTGGAVPQKVLDTIWEWYDSLPEEEVIPENEDASQHLKDRMMRLALKRPLRSPDSEMRFSVTGTYIPEDKSFSFRQKSFFVTDDPLEHFRALSVSFETQSVTFNGTCSDGRERSLTASMDGSLKENRVPGLADRGYASALWVKENLLRLTVRYVETCNEQYFDFLFEKDRFTLEISTNHTFSEGQKDRYVFVKVG